MTSDPRSEIITKFARNRRLAHRVLFAHRHPDETPPFHEDIVDRWHSPAPKVLLECFRGGAKSTLSEEAIALLACFREFANCIILGESEGRAVDRLRAIKHELEYNESLIELFGSMVGPTWTDKKVVLANGVCIQAFGRGQSMRGVKHLQARPDLVFGDDMEDDEAVATPEAQEKTERWWYSVVVPALDPKARVRIAGTPLDPKALLVKLANSFGPENVVKVPWESVDPETGARRATWPDRFPLSFIDRTRGEFMRNGRGHDYVREYMCEAEDPASKAFHDSMLKVEPRVRAWQAVYAMYDPARTVKKRSASTGVAIWSWVGARLVVWDAYGQTWLPDQIIDDIFRVNQEYRPIAIGVEEDGLNEFVLQPLRQEQVRRAEAIPLRALKAPRGKIDFIKSLQPFFKAGEVTFAKELPDLRAQLLSFPTGLIDVPNALAFALRMRPGQPIYDGFTAENISESLSAARGASPWLLVNATQSLLTAILVQSSDGVLRVLADWVREGDPGLHLEDILRDAGLEAGRKPTLVAPLVHFGLHDTIGLRAAARKIPVEIRRGGLENAGREDLRRMFGRKAHGQPAVVVSTRAAWTLNALSGGYCRAMGKNGVLSDEAEPGAYRTLMEALESFCALLGTGYADESSRGITYAVTGDGRRYATARG